MAQGLSFESFAGVLGVSDFCIENWARTHEDFHRAKTIGTQKSRLFWEKIGIRGCLGLPVPGFEYQTGNFNAAVWIFNMKNRFKWRDTFHHRNDESNVEITLAYDPQKIAQGKEDDARAEHPQTIDVPNEPTDA